MDKPSKLNERLTLIANIAVVLGIVFLALELRQNTSMMQAQIRDSISEKQMGYLLTVAATPTLAGAVTVGSNSGRDSLIDPRERVAYTFYAQAVLREWENSYYQYTVGLFSEEEFAGRMGSWRSNLSRPGFRDVWFEVRDRFAPDFRAEVDAIVAEVQ